MIITEQVLGDLCARAGMSESQAHKAVADITSQKIKDLLKATVAEAVGQGAYGAPTMVVTSPGKDKMAFFGSDRFEQLAFSLGLPYYGPDPSRPTVSGPKL